ncbi:MAG: GTPase HflX [Lachnospiraceae bacterium]|nr:GTPase HflX [Lachnospiraceae bacterium]
MAALIETESKPERLLLVGVSVSDEQETRDSLDELEELAQTVGAVTICTVIQNREAVHPGLYVGKGKIEEIAELVMENRIDTVVCDDELSPAQIKNLELALQAKVIDRTILILDIFAMRAKTSEGKIQVELAQLKYRSSRLVGLRSSLSRLGGGIGTRGPGEKKLEMDRRLIRERISILNAELEDVKRTRQISRQKRMDSAIPCVAIVGYTNAGKSTLLNTVTGAGILEEDKLFATLDPTTRVYEYENGQQVLFTDTVGFINKLPHHLVDAFRSTLEEAKYADIILHVVDISNPHADRQMDVVYDTLSALGIHDKPIITLYNKIDREDADKAFVNDIKSKKTLRISAKKGYGLADMFEAVNEIVEDGMSYVEVTIPYGEAGKLQDVRKYGQLLCEEYNGDGIFIKAHIPKALEFRLRGAHDKLH